MNCICQPPKPVVVRKVLKEGPTKGKDFFCCCGENGKCDFFQWMTPSEPPSMMNFRRSKNTSRKYSRGGNAKITLRSITYNGNPPMIITLSLMCPKLEIVSNFMRTLPSQTCRYNTLLKCWEFGFESYSSVIKAFDSEEFKREDLQLEQFPRFLVNGLKDYLRYIDLLPNTSQINLNILPSLQRILLPFQEEGIRFIVNRGGRGLIGDEMGKYVFYFSFKMYLIS
jgi:hypothetical protein